MGESNPTHLISSASKTRRKLLHTGSSLRNGTGNRGKQPTRPDRIEKSEEREREDFSNIKYEAAMCYLRGICYSKQNAFDKAKECYKDAVRIDVQCFEAFDALMKNSLMSPDEEWALLDSLDFDSIPALDTSTAQEASEFVKMLYTTRLSKYKRPTDFAAALEGLSTHYNLTKNPDMQLARAELLFTQCRFNDALTITEEILKTDEFNFSIYPLHLACLHELSMTRTLYLIAHKLAALHPEEPATWLAVGIYNMSISRIPEARQFFSKASMMDPHFGSAWIGFAHTFAAEGEHDQAISAYSTAARLFQGTHLPQLFLGMQNLQLNNMVLAGEYLSAAANICNTDPLLLNEIGVVHYHSDRLPEAIAFFTRALELASSVNADPKSWLATRANLGHAYRRSSKWNESIDQFDEVLRLGGKDCGIFCSKGIVLLENHRTYEAITMFHEALMVQPQDPVATDLLSRALDELGRGEFVGGGGTKGMRERQVEEGLDKDVERVVDLRKREVRKKIRGKIGGKRMSGGIRGGEGGGEGLREGEGGQRRERQPRFYPEDLSMLDDEMEMDEEVRGTPMR